MAKNVTLEGLRRDYSHSIYGRKLAMDSDDFILGPKGLRVGGEGFSSAGSTIPSSSVVTTLSDYGYSIIGTTGSSGTSAASTATQQLPAPNPGVTKVIANVSTATMGISTVTGASYFMATDSSTYQYADFAGRSALTLLGVSTAHWLVTNNGEISAVALTSAASTSFTVTKRVTLS